MFLWGHTLRIGGRLEAEEGQGVYRLEGCIVALSIAQGYPLIYDADAEMSEPIN
jgi:hypothetical protein